MFDAREASRIPFFLGGDRGFQVISLKKWGKRLAQIMQSNRAVHGMLSRIKKNIKMMLFGTFPRFLTVECKHNLFNDIC